MFIGSFQKGDKTFPNLALNIKTPVDNITTFHKQETFAFFNVEKMLSNYVLMNNFLQDYILWWKKVLANNQSTQVILSDQCIGYILEEDLANHSTIAFPPMSTKLDKVAAQISFSRIHHAVEGEGFNSISVIKRFNDLLN